MRKIINIALVLTLLAGLCVPATAAGTAFTDVPAGNWAHSFVQRAAEQEWVSGVGGGRYDPNSHVTFGQFALMLSKAIYANDIAAQPAGAQWWTAACEVADQHGLFTDTDMANRSSWTSVANTPIKREQMAQVMYNALADVGAKLPSYEEYSEVALGIGDIIDTYHDEAVAVCYTLKLLSGNGNGYFEPHDPMTRAQAAVVLCNIHDYVVGSDPDQPTTPAETRGIVGVTCTQVPETSSDKVLDVITTIKTSGFQAGTKLSIEPKEPYSGVIMPDDTTAMIEGTGDATFKEIRFTAPGTYSFEIYAEEGMEHYRYDARTWELTVTVTGTAGAPIGAVGGQYDVSSHDVPADTNKDGWITEAEVQAVLAQLRVEYPDGSAWGENTRYPGRSDGKGLGAASACAGFANMVSDRIFGTLPAYHVSLEETRVGDIMDDGPANHRNIVLNDYGKDMFEGVNYTDSYTTANGNTSGIVTWDSVRYYADWPTGTPKTYIRSRYPAGTNTPSTIALDSAVYTRGGTTTTDGASFITTCLDTPTWSAETKERARKIMAGMTLEEKVGQLFMLHYPGDGSGTAAQAADLIDKYHPGGYLVFANMFNNSTPDAVRQKIADTQAASDIPLLFTVDEEGGKVVRISDKSQYGHDPFLSPQELKAAGGLAAVAADTIDKAAFLKDLGLNVNYAPVADTAGPSGYMYARTWGGDGLENAAYVETLVEAAEGTGVGTTVKHFPGYGGTSANTHNGFAVNELTLDDFYYNDLLPFHAGIAAGGRAVMVTHNTIGCLDGGKPASAL